MDFFNDSTTIKRDEEPPKFVTPTHNLANNCISVKDFKEYLEMNPEILEKSFTMNDNPLWTPRTISGIKRDFAEYVNRVPGPKKKKPRHSDEALNDKFQLHKKSSVFEQPWSKDYDFENRDFAEFIHNDAYSNYKPAKLKIGKPHPYTVVESRSLMSAEVPDIKYKLNMPQKIIDKGILSNVQLEAVVYACQKHDEDLLDDKRLGFLIGDGAGVGKGRTIGGIIFENYLCGRKKALWISVSGDLKLDAERDLEDIGKPIKVDIKVAALNKMSYNDIDSAENGKFTEGVLFVTYSSLISKSKNMGKNKFSKRLDQIIEWFGKDYDGVLILDECHKAKNLQRNSKTKTGGAVKTLQDKLRLARVVYASATGASEPKHMAYMVRLGLWGRGKRFSGFEDFQSTLSSLGVGAMELIAIEMKTKGIYLARQLSFQGVKFEMREIKVGDSIINGHKFKDVYNKCVEVWVRIYRDFKAAFARNKLTDKDENLFESQFWSAHQRFFKYLCIAGKIPECVKMAKAEVEERERCVVIGLQSTGEAQTMDILEETTGDIFDFVSSAKSVIINLIENHYPSAQNLQKNRDRVKSKKASRLREAKGMKRKAENLTELDDFFETILDKKDDSLQREGGDDYNDDDGDEYEDEDDVIILGYENHDNIPELVDDKTDLSVLDRKIKENMLKTVEDIDSMFPFNALDLLIRELGGSNVVAEMTGRKGRILENQGCISYHSRKEEEIAMDQTNILEKNRFNNGEKKFAIISDAASTGISLHSDKRFKNKKQRFHITLELPWSADKAIQQFGRTHRSNQFCSPHYVFLISDLAGERRFAATIAKRLESLGALTHGDRRCADNRDFGQFNFDNEIGQRSVNNLLHSIDKNDWFNVPFPKEHLQAYGNDMEMFQNLAQKALKTVGLNENRHVTVTKFLNRILGIEIDMQNALFQYFLDIMDEESVKAKARNEFDQGIKDIMNEHDTVYIEETIIFNELSMNDDEIIKINKIKNIDGGISWDMAFKKYSSNPKRYLFCVSNSFENLFMALAEYKSDDSFILITPNFPEKCINRESLDTMWQKRDPCDIQKDWEYVHRESENRCLHAICNENCPKRFCTYGQRTKTSYIITGAVFSAFKLIGPLIRKCVIGRIELHDGFKLIGAMVSPAYYKVVMNTLKAKYNDQRCDKFEVPQFIESKRLKIEPKLNEREQANKDNNEGNTGKKKKGKSVNAIDMTRINDIINKQFKKPVNVNKTYVPRAVDVPVLKKERKLTEISSLGPVANVTVQFYSDKREPTKKKV